MIAQTTLTSGQYVRSGPSTHHAAIAIAVPSDLIVVWGRQENGYSEVQLGDIRGWMNSARLRTFGHALPGVHGGADWTWQLPENYQNIVTAKLKAVTVLCQGAINGNVVNQLHANGVEFIHARLYNKDFPKPALQYVQEIEEPLARLYDAGIRYFSAHNEPNLTNEGMYKSWNNGAEFGVWFQTAVDYLAPRYPLARWGWPAMSPGHATEDRADPILFMQQASEYIDRADWMCQHAYWGYGVTWAQALQNIDAFAHQYQRLIVVSEFSNPDPNVSLDTKGNEYGLLLNAAPAALPPNVLALTSFVLDNDGFPYENWKGSNIPSIVGSYL